MHRRHIGIQKRITYMETPRGCIPNHPIQYTLDPWKQVVKKYIWNNSIMGNNPLEQNQDLHTLKSWMDSQNLLTLYDISKFSECSDRWIKWSIGSPSSHLHTLLPILFSSLKECTPWDLSTPY